jgi:competence protein ComGC
MVLMRPHRKKAFFFTLIAMLVVTVMLLLFSLTAVNISKNREEVVKTRVESVNDFMLSLEGSFYQRALLSSGYRALQTMVRYTNLTQEYIPNFENEFKNVVLYGGLNITGELGITDRWNNMTEFDAIIAVKTIGDEELDQTFP